MELATRLGKVFERGKILAWEITTVREVYSSMAVLEVYMFSIN